MLPLHSLSTRMKQNQTRLGTIRKASEDRLTGLRVDVVTSGQQKAAGAVFSEIDRTVTLTAIRQAALREHSMQEGQVRRVFRPDLGHLVGHFEVDRA